MKIKMQGRGSEYSGGVLTSEHSSRPVRVSLHARNCVLKRKIPFPLISQMLKKRETRFKDGCVPFERKKRDWMCGVQKKKNYPSPSSTYVRI